MPEPDVHVREVGLRDGLQNVTEFFSTESKLQWLVAEYECNVHQIQVCSFVPPKVFAQFKDCLEVVQRALTLPDLTVSAYVPNVKGAQRAFESGVHIIDHVVSASEGHNRSNLRRTAADSMEDFRGIAELRSSSDEWKDIKLIGCVATSFGCTIDGQIDPDVVMGLVDQYVEMGADEIMLADTVGFAGPTQVAAMFERLKSHIGDLPMWAHFHDTRGLGLANVVAALEAGVRRFDSSIAGLGGCPFAPGATGNIVTEDLVFMLESMGLSTGIDLERLVEVQEIVRRELPNEPLRSSIAKAGLPKGFELVG